MESLISGLSVKISEDPERHQLDAGVMKLKERIIQCGGKIISEENKDNLVYYSTLIKAYLDEEANTKYMALLRNG